jgi:hypothetical protein
MSDDELREVEQNLTGSNTGGVGMIAQNRGAQLQVFALCSAGSEAFSNSRRT